MYSLIRRLLFAMDAEDAHDLVTRQMIALQRIPLALRMIEQFCVPPRQPRELMGLTFPSPVGIAAGFDQRQRDRSRQCGAENRRRFQEVPACGQSR